MSCFSVFRTLLIVALVAFVTPLAVVIGAETPPTPPAPPTPSTPSAPVVQPADPKAEKETQPKPVTDADGDKKTSPKKEIKTMTPIVVTANRLETPIEKTGVATTVISDETLATSQTTNAGSVLQNVPGLTMAQSGKEGDFTQLFTRGGNSNHTQILYDGFKVNLQGGGFSFESVDPIGVEAIEVVRGPASGLFGTDAMTGAVNFITKEGEGPLTLTTSAAGGTYGRTRETLNLQGREKQFSYNVSTAFFHRGEAQYANTEMNVWNYAGRFDYKFNEAHALKFTFRGNEFNKGASEYSVSGYGTAVEPVNPTSHIHNSDLLLGLEYRGQIAPIWETVVKTGGNILTHRFINKDAPPPSNVIPAPFNTLPANTYINKELRPSIDWQNNITTFEQAHIRNVTTVGFFAEHEKDTQENSSIPAFKRDHTNTAEYLQNRVELFDRAFITAGARREQNEEFGSFLTGHGDVSILIPESNSRIHGSVGNSFRAPSFFELFDPTYGSADLTPEENFAYDVGFAQNFLKKKIEFNATWFHNSFDNLIGYDPATFKAININTAETYGVEFEAAFHPIKQLSLESTMTFLHSEDATGLELLRRPSRTYTERLVVHPLQGLVADRFAGLDISLEFITFSDRKDIGPSAASSFGRVTLPGYTKADIAVSYKFYKHLRAFAKIENFTDTKYENVATFPAYGSNTMAGLEFSWKW